MKAKRAIAKQQKTRGKGKPLSIEAARLAYVIRKVRRDEGILIGDGRRLVPGKKWAEQMLWKTAGVGNRTLSQADRELRRINRSDSDALRVFAIYSRQWDAEGLKWGECALKMSWLGFPDFKEMKRGTFIRFRERAEKLYPGQVSQRKSKVRHNS